MATIRMHISAMHLTVHTDYAMRILMFAASRAPGSDDYARFSVAIVSAAFGLSRNHTMKIVQRLSRAGYLKSMRGRGGGLVLGQPAESIRVGQVIRFLEQDHALVACFVDRTACRIGGRCVLERALHAALCAFYQSLDRFTLADLALHPALVQSLRAPGGPAGSISVLPGA